jgi:hypothetical protein
MALEGTIKDFGLADILQLIGIQRKTGVLNLDGDDDTVTVKFLNGHVVGADTRRTNLEDLLGSVLVRTGRITEAQLQETLRIQKSTLQRLGYILVKQRFISEEDLVEALRIQVTQIVYRLFRWRDGKYQFTPADHVEYDTEHFQPLSTETILMEGARMIDEWPIIERRIKSPAMVIAKTAAGAGLDAPVASLLETDIDFGFQDAAPGDGRAGKDEIRLSPEERDVLHMVDGTSCVQDLVDASPLGEFDVYRILYDLTNRNLIEEVVVPVLAGVAPEDDTRGRWASGVLQVLVWALAALGLVTVPMNPWTPWRIAAQGAEIELLKTYESRSRIERVERGLQIYFMDRGALPPSLQALAATGWFPPADTLDPWGRPYAYRADAAGYEIAGAGPDGAERDDLVVRHPFSAPQRMVLEGGSPERDRPDSR